MPPLLALCHLLTTPKGAEPWEVVLSPWGHAESAGFGMSLPGQGPHAGLVGLTWAGLWPLVALWQSLWLGEQTGISCPLLCSAVRVVPRRMGRGSHWAPHHGCHPGDVSGRIPLCHRAGCSRGLKNPGPGQSLGSVV